MKLQTFIVCPMMKSKIVPQAIKVSGSQLMDLMVCSTESSKMQLLSAIVVVRLLCSYRRFLGFLHVARYSMYFVHAKSFQSLGFNDNVGHLVQEGSQKSVFRVENISRKVILAKDEDVAGHPSYLVVGYLRRIFPVTPGTVVVPYFPCINDMVFVQGDDEPPGGLEF